MPKRTRDHQSWLIEKLTDPKRAASYLNAAREDSQEMFFEALRDVAQARQNMSHLAKDADVTRRSLYKVTATQLARYRYEYQRAFSMYCGPLPDFEEWVAKQERQKKISRADPETGQPTDRYGD